jgi:hypothetical protein
MAVVGLLLETGKVDVDSKEEGGFGAAVVTIVAVGKRP